MTRDELRERLSREVEAWCAKDYATLRKELADAVAYERGEGSDVLRLRRRPENRAHEADREDHLECQGLVGSDSRPRVGGPEGPDIPEEPVQEEDREDGPEQLGRDVPGHALPRKVLPGCERDADGRVEMGSRSGPHEQDDRHHHETR
jgi:hypothetical protein